MIKYAIINNYLTNVVNVNYTGTSFDWGVNKTNEELIYSDDNIRFYKYKLINNVPTEQTVSYVNQNNVYKICGSFDIPTGFNIVPQSEYDLEIARQKKAKILKEYYLLDILWTDDSKMFYDKLKLHDPANTSKDSWWTDIMLYWGESYIERKENKTNLINASTVTAVNNVDFNPVHVKNRNEI